MVIAALALSAVVVLSACTATATPTPTTSPRSLGIDFETATIAQLQAGLTAGDYSAVELSDAYVARIESVNTTGPSLRAVQSIVSTWREQAQAADARRKEGTTRGPLDGVPVIVKDNIDIEGQVTSAGSLALADNVAVSNSAVADRLKAAGAVIIAKSTLVEFAFWNGADSWGYSSLGGQPLNPYDASYSTSGSSAGSAIAAAAGLAAITVGSDTGGSVITPAAHLSVVGYRPSTGLISRTGIVPITDFADTAGVLGRTVTDAALGATALLGADEKDPATDLAARHPGLDLSSGLDTAALKGARIGIPAGLSLDDEESTLWAKSIETLQKAGATVVSVPWQATTHPFATVMYQFRTSLDRYLTERTASDFPIKDVSELADFYREHPQETQKYGADNLFTAEKVDVATGAAGADAVLEQARTAMTANVDGLVTQYDLDAFVFPESFAIVLEAPILGMPEISVPSGYQAKDRHPYGVTFLGERGDDARLFGYAYAYEQAGEPRKTPSEINPTMWRCLERPSTAEEQASEHCLP